MAKVSGRYHTIKRMRTRHAVSINSYNYWKSLLAVMNPQGLLAGVFSASGADDNSGLRWVIFNNDVLLLARNCLRSLLTVLSLSVVVIIIFVCSNNAVGASIISIATVLVIVIVLVLLVVDNNSSLHVHVLALLVLLG
jgi:hypothetical protein